ncbi:response regulator [Methylobacterium terricola]|uniref:Response regulator n=2 Tax=Methylobacterium terricola TaxID=2583531 RepID=A0A5C4L4V6_9HYPH|nr:response regulator [Methylobacterium terricola]
MGSLKPGAVALVAEDEALIRMEAADMLADAGFGVFEASTAGAALGYLEAHPEVILVMTDIRMPGPSDGLALAHAVRARWPEMGIIIVSGRVFPTPAELPRGAHFIGKPYHVSQIRQVLREMGMTKPHAQHSLRQTET